MLGSHNQQFIQFMIYRIVSVGGCWGPFSFLFHSVQEPLRTSYYMIQYVPYVLQHNKESIVYATNWKQKDKGTKPLIHEKYSNDDYAITLTKPLILQHWQVMYIAPTNIEIQHNHWLTLPIIKYSSYTELIQFPCNRKS